MMIPSNRWCNGSGTAAVQSKDNDKAHCPTCGYQFQKASGVVPQHRPKFNERKIK